jgi:hypothetical protein
VEGVIDYIMMHEGRQRELLHFFHDLLMEQPGMQCKISYKVPFYSLRQRICYLVARKDGSVEIAFPRGHQLSNEQGILEPSGRKYITGLRIKSIAEVPHEALHEVIQEAILLDEIPYTPPYAFKKKNL